MFNKYLTANMKDYEYEKLKAFDEGLYGREYKIEKDHYVPLFYMWIK